MLDPENWDAFRVQSHRMLDDMIDSLQQIRQQPVWQDADANIRSHFHTPLPTAGKSLSSLHREFMDYILPYAVGNRHPGFMGWVHGGGTAAGMMAEMLAAGLNANVGGRNQIPLEVERQVIAWMREMFGFPERASGVLTSGTSAATLIAVVTSRDAVLEAHNRTTSSPKLIAYASKEVHGCLCRAISVIGLGKESLRKIPCNHHHQIDLAALQQQIRSDQNSGYTPWFVAGSAGTVNTGAIDDLDALADVAKSVGAWFHVDGAYGALAMLVPELAPRLHGIARADSLAMDFHKWAQVPYDAGMVLIRNGDAHRKSFAAADSYLQREEEGLAANSPWPCDYGIDLSRGFRALKVWFTFQSFGSEKIGSMILHCCHLAQSLAQQIDETPELELMAEVSLNIVCYRYCGDKSRPANYYDAVNRAIVRHIQLSGIAAPSLTYIHHRAVIRAALVNHRTSQQDIDKLLTATANAIDVCRTTALPNGEPCESK